jgi:hypothetical protein
MKKDIAVLILCGVGIFAVLRGCKLSDETFYKEVGKRALCEKNCYPRKAIYDRELDNCDCEDKK